MTYLAKIVEALPGAWLEPRHAHDNQKQMGALRIIRQILGSHDKRNIDSHKAALEQLLDEPLTDRLQTSTLAPYSPLASTPLNANSSSRRTPPPGYSGDSGVFSIDASHHPGTPLADSASSDAGKNPLPKKI